LVGEKAAGRSLAHFDTIPPYVQSEPMTSLSKLLGLAPHDRQLLLQAVLIVALVRIGLSLLPFRTLQRALSRLARLPAAEPSSAPPVERLLWAIRAASRRVPRASCLTQALAGQVLLARHGHRARLRIGVGRDEAGRLAGHAWLEQHGTVVLGADPDREYTPIEGLEWQASPLAASLPHITLPGDESHGFSGR
jgi:hypothetical protein